MRGGLGESHDRVGICFLVMVLLTVGNWVTKYKKDHGSTKERQAAPEAVEIACLRKQVLEPWRENEFLKKRRQPSS